MIFLSFNFVQTFAKNRMYHSTSRRLFSSLSHARNIIPVSDTIKPFKPILVSIEGNIGAGKSTLLKKLQSTHPEWIYIDEPVDQWSKVRNEADESLLEVFYKDRKRWSYTFQNFALLTRYQNIESTVNKERISYPNAGNMIFFTERCLDTDYYVFTKMLRAEGSIDLLELSIYERWLNQLRTTATPLSAIIYLNTPPLLCKERIKIRGRTGEDAISLDYLTSLDSYQNTWVTNANIPKLSTDGTDYREIENFILNLLKPSYSDNTATIAKNSAGSNSTTKSVLY